jgi:hypothetical protein
MQGVNLIPDLNGIAYLSMTGWGLYLQTLPLQ